MAFWIFVAVLLSSAQFSHQCGMLTHIDVTLRALNHYAPSLDVTLGYPYSRVLTEYRDYLMAGSVFPDWGYVCNQMGGEVAHWEPFLFAF